MKEEPKMFQPCKACDSTGVEQNGSGISCDWCYGLGHRLTQEAWRALECAYYHADGPFEQYDPTWYGTRL